MQLPIGFCWLALLFALAGCTHVPSVQERVAHTDKLAEAAGWQRELLSLASIPLVAYLPSRQVKSSTLTIYIEGDGLAWISAQRPSLNPTPILPLALQLALAQPDGSAVYLARPYQYVDGGVACHQRYWTDARFAEEVVAASNAAIDLLKQKFAATHIQLVGYSGGGAVAVLLAARRTDVIGLVTVAGNLNHILWSRQHRLSPLSGSLNPLEVRHKLHSVEQLHLVGGRDENIFPELSEHFVAGLPAARRRVIVEFDHQCCWVKDWPVLWEEWSAR